MDENEQRVNSTIPQLQSIASDVIGQNIRRTQIIRYSNVRQKHRPDIKKIVDGLEISKGQKADIVRSSLNRITNVDEYKKASTAVGWNVGWNGMAVRLLDIFNNPIMESDLEEINRILRSLGRDEIHRSQLAIRGSHEIDKLSIVSLFLKKVVVQGVVVKDCILKELSLEGVIGAICGAYCVSNYRQVMRNDQYYNCLNHSHLSRHLLNLLENIAPDTKIDYNFQSKIKNFIIGPLRRLGLIGVLSNVLSILDARPELRSQELVERLTFVIVSNFSPNRSSSVNALGSLLSLLETNEELISTVSVKAVMNLHARTKGQSSKQHCERIMQLGLESERVDIETKALLSRTLESNSSNRTHSTREMNRGQHGHRSLRGCL